MDNFQERVFNVGEITGDIDLNSPPATGEEYIKQVMLEARQCQEVVVKRIATTNNSETIECDQPTTTNNTPGYLIPEQDWQNIQIKDFTKARVYIDKLRSKPDLLSLMTKGILNSMPDYDDEKKWINICSGNSKVELYQPPNLITVLSLNQPTTEQVLDYLITHIQHENKITIDVGRWVYALLVSLELPLNPDTCSSLRLLAKFCRKRRISQNSIQSPEINIYNLFICLVARYYRQLDLADDYNEITK